MGVKSIPTSSQLRHLGPNGRQYLEALATELDDHYGQIVSTPPNHPGRSNTLANIKKRRKRLQALLKLNGYLPDESNETGPQNEAN